MTQTAAPTTKATPLLFVYAYHNLPGISDGEWIEYFGPKDGARLLWDIRSYLQDQLDLFRMSADYGEYFSVAGYDVALEALGEDQLEIFRSALAPEERSRPLADLHSADIFDGLRAVMIHNLDAGAFDDVRAALRLFNEIISSAVEGTDERNPGSYIQIQTAGEFAPWFIDRLLESVGSLTQEWGVDPYRRFVGERIEHLKPLLDMLQKRVRREGWPRNDFALGGVLLVVDYYRQVVVESWSG
jgi:hypothetical protein